jgi:hypothetical protein
MKKSIIAIGVSIFLFTLFAFPAFSQVSGAKLLKIETPTSGKNKLLFNLDHLEKIVEAFNLKENSAAIELTDMDGVVLAVLGKIKKGKVKWSHKVVDGKSLLVKFNKDEYQLVLGKVKEKALRPGLIVQAGDTKKEMSTDQEYGKKTRYIESKTVLGSFEITFAESPDLAVMVKYPIKAAPGEALHKDVSITVENKGTVASGEFSVELVISSDIKIPTAPAAYSETYKDDSLLEGGKATVASIKPGEKTIVPLKGPLKIPPDTEPGRYYLAAVVDPEGKIEELREDNNRDVRFIMVELPAPNKLTVELPETQLIYLPKGFVISVMYEGMQISDTREWRKCMIRPYVHQIKHAAWEGFFWEVDTDDRSLWQVYGINFCKKGGKATEVKLKVAVEGGSKNVPPKRFTLKMTDAHLEYEPASGRFKVLSHDNQIVYIPHWQSIRKKPHIYHFKHQLWGDFFWVIDTFKKQLRKVTGVQFGQDGGNEEVLKAVIKVE